MNDNLVQYVEDDNMKVSVKSYIPDNDDVLIQDPRVPIYPWNVITEFEFKKRIKNIFSMVADALKNTLGPYGSSTLIESLGTYHLTKDGFTVLKNIHFNDRTNNTILNTILTISHQMVMKVGDGSTSSIIAAHNFLRRLESDEVLGSLRSRDLKQAINRFVDVATDYIQTNATEVTDDNYWKTVTDIARVATNDDEIYTSIISDIYEKCGKDVSISKSMSETNDAYYTIKEDMFYIDASYLDKIYCNSDNGNKSILKDAGVVFFNFTLENKHWELVVALQNTFSKLDPEGKRQLVIIAPYYDNYFLDRVKLDINKFRTWYQQQVKQGGAIPFPLVFGKAPFYKDIQRDIYDDATAFLGCSMVSPVDADSLLEQLSELSGKVMLWNEYEKFKAIFPRPEEADSEWLKTHSYIPERVDDQLDEYYDSIASRIGTCTTTTLAEKTIEFTGLHNAEQSMVELRTSIAKGQMEKEMAEVENLRYVSKDYIAAKERMSRLALKSANIFIGGNSELEKKLNDDAVDDAIKACTSAVRYGVNPGCNVSIMQACIPEINEKLKEESDTVQRIASICYESFLDVMQTIFTNKYKEYSRESITQLAETMAFNNQCFDLVEEQFSNDVINSCRTDIEILRSAIAIIGVILSSNQYLAADIK